MTPFETLRDQIVAFDGLDRSVGDGPERLFARFKAMPLDLLVKADWNYKEEDVAKSRKLLANIRRNGQVENILVRELETGFYEVVNGNHRFDAFQEAGFTRVFVYDFGRIGLAEAKRLALETNETKFDSDQMKLAEMLRELNEEFDIDDLTETLPFSVEEMSSMDRLLDFSWEAPQLAGEDAGNNAGEESEIDKTKKLELRLPEETFNVWQKWRERCLDLLGYDTPERAFELAVVEALNIPEDSLR